MPRVELKSLQTFLAIKHNQKTKKQKLLLLSSLDACQKSWPIYVLIVVNSLTAMDGHDRPHFNELLW